MTGGGLSPYPSADILTERVPALKSGGDKAAAVFSQLSCGRCRMAAGPAGRADVSGAGHRPVLSEFKDSFDEPL